MEYALHRPSPAQPAAHLTAAAPPPYYPPASSYLSAPNPISAAAASTAANPYPSPAANYVAAYASYGRYTAAATAAAADPGVGHATTETPSYYYNTADGTGGHSLRLNEGDAPSKDPGLGQAYYYNAVGGSDGGGYGHGPPAREGAGNAVGGSHGGGYGHVLPAREGAGNAVGGSHGGGYGHVLPAREGAGNALGGSHGGGYGHVLPAREGAGTAVGGSRGRGYGHVLPAREGAGNAVGGSHGGGYGHVLPTREGAGAFMDQGQGHAPSSYYRGALGGSGSGGYGNGLSVAPYSDVSLGQARAALWYPYNSAAGGGGGGGGGAGGGYAHGLVVKEAIRQYGFDPQVQQTQIWSSTGLEPTVRAQPSQIPLLRSNATINNVRSREMTRQPPMRVNKVAQPASCEVCKIKCNNKEVLMIHKQGKKHKRNMLKLQEAITAKPARVQVTGVDKKDEGSWVASEDKAVGEQKKRAAPEPATVEDLQMKKKRLLEGGAAASEIKICTICNVVVNSQQVLDYHLAGQKHAAMVEQQAS